MPDGIEVDRGDLRDAATVEAVLRGVDLVNNQAAVVRRGKETPDARHRVGSTDLGTATLLAGRTRAGIGRLILAGSVVIHGPAPVVAPTRGAP